MKLKSLTLALGTLGIVVLTPMVRSSVAQTAPANALPLYEYDPMAMQECDRVFAQYAEGTPEDGLFFDDFKGLNLTDAQRRAYDVLDAQKDESITEVYERSVRIEDLTANLSFRYAANIDMEYLDTVVPPDVRAAIQAALNENPTVEQQNKLNQEFGQYGEFIGTTIVHVTPDQVEESDQIMQDFYAQVQEIMTTEQLPQYQENLAARLEIDAVCGHRGSFSTSE